MDFKPMLLSTVNNSIGNKKNHITVEKLLSLFSKKTYLSELDKYIIDTIQTEATKEEINNFKNIFHIQNEDINYVLSINPYR